MFNSSFSSQPSSSKPAEQKRFRLLRNFSLVSLSGFVLTTSLLAVLYRKQAVRNTVISTEESNVALTQVLSNTLWPEYGDFLTSTQSLSTEALLAAEESRQLQETIVTQLEGLSVVKVKIFDLEGRTVFSTDPKQIGIVKKESAGLSAALSGNVLSQLGHRDTFRSLESVTLEDRHLLSSYIPIRTGGATGEIKGVFEVYTDVTPALLRIRLIQRNSILYSMLLLSTLYGVLITFVRKADRLISSQYQHVEASEVRYRKQSEALETALSDLKRTQTQMIHSEKMSGLGQMMAGVAHEINNPVNFIHGNLAHVDTYVQDVLKHLELYEATYPEPPAKIQVQAEDLEIDFVREDLDKTLASMKLGTERIREIVLSLRIFSRLDESECKYADIHEGIESTLMILRHRLQAAPNRPEIRIVRDYDELPRVECYAGQLNQVFMNLLVNAIDALEDSPDILEPQIVIRTERRVGGASPSGNRTILVSITNKGPAMPVDVKDRIFEPFFTTKEVGKGTGMGLAICHQLITEKHKGKIECFSDEERGTEFVLEIPIKIAKTTSDCS